MTEIPVQDRRGYIILPQHFEGGGNYVYGTPTQLDAQYDRVATAKLIELFMRHPSVKRVLFNDSAIPGVRPATGHDNHFHAELR